jgi:hypothetical protein
MHLAPGIEPVGVTSAAGFASWFDIDLDFRQTSTYLAVSVECL